MSITGSTVLDTEFGKFKANFHRLGTVELVSLVHGDVTAGIPFVRIQSACLFGQTMHSKLCDCRKQLDDAMLRVQAQGGVIVISPRGEGKGAGLETKVRAMELERINGCKADEAYIQLGYPSDDLREFTLEAQALIELGVTKRIKLLTDNEKKRAAVIAAGSDIVVTPHPNG